MLDSKIRLAVIVGLPLFLVLAVVTGTPDWSGQLRAEEPAPRRAKKSKLEDLLKERLATVREISRLVKARFKSGEATVDQLREASRMLLEAELELCGSDKDRIKVWEMAVVEAKELERIADNFAKTGQGHVSAALAAKADRLQAEIALERAKAKAAVLPGGGKAAQESEGQHALAEKQAAIK